MSGRAVTAAWRTAAPLIMVALGLSACSTGPVSAPSAGPVPAVRSNAPSVPAPSHRLTSQARAAALHFYALYGRSRYAASWDLLSPAYRHAIPQRVWVRVHAACASPDAAKPRTISGVTVFGSGAIIAESVAGAANGPAEDVFNRVDGRWTYSPEDLSVYHHRSVAADIEAARASGLCAGWKIF